MKKSSEWIRQADFDKGADTLIQTGQATTEAITAYQVAQHIGAKANSSIYAKFYDWRQRQNAARSVGSIELPQDMVAALRTGLDRATTEIEAMCHEMVRSMARAFDETASLRVASAKRDQELASAMTRDALGEWRTAEDVLDAITDERDALKLQLEAVKGECSELRGQLKALEPLLARIRNLPPAGEANTSEVAEAGNLPDTP